MRTVRSRAAAHARRLGLPFPTRNLMPASRQYGFDRGTPIDRWYMEDFLDRHGARPGYTTGDIRGRVLEIGGSAYTRRFGTDLERVDVLHGAAGNPEATFVGDLVEGAGLPSDAYDCVVCMQTLMVIYDVRGAIDTLHRVLRPGGVLILTVSGICQAARPDRDLWGDYWRFTTGAIRRLCEERFDAADVRVEGYGNLVSCVAMLQGQAAEELRPRELIPRDPDYELLVAARAQKQSGPS